MNNITIEVKTLGDFCNDCLDFEPVEGTVEFAGDKIVSQEYECSLLYRCRRIAKFIQEHGKCLEE